MLILWSMVMILFTLYLINHLLGRYDINIVIHEWRWFKKTKSYITLWNISFFNNSIFRMFKNASAKLDAALWYKQNKHGFQTKK